jgi:uncharacterized protein (DUF433 family)
MSLSLVAEMWLAVKESIISSDRSIVADNVISMLIDHDISPDEIRKSFRGEGDIIDALKYYMDSEDWSSDDEEDESDDELYFDDNDEDDENW